MAADPVLTLLHRPGSAAPRRLDAAPGTSLVLGSCDCRVCAPDLVLPAWPGVWFRCVIDAREDHWRLDNPCRDIEVTVVDLENPDLRISAAPGRGRLVVPFEFAEVTFRVGPHAAGEPVTVIGPEVQRTDPVPACPSSVAALRDVDLRPGSTGLAVLEELCSATRGTGLLPSSAALARRLSARGLALTPRAVDAHVDYLFRRLFPDAGAPSVRGYKRWALVSLMLRRADH